MVIIAEHKSYAFKFRVSHQAFSMLVAVEVWFNFFIESQHTRNLIQILIYIFANKAVLSFKNITQEIDVVGQSCVLHDGCISLATHTDSNYIFKLTVTLESVFPELCNSLTVFPEVPGITVNRTRTANIAVFLAVTTAWLVVAGPHNNTHFISKLCICKARTIQTELRRPHCRPEVVSLEAE